jgi:zinc protease
MRRTRFLLVLGLSAALLCALILRAPVPAIAAGGGAAAAPASAIHLPLEQHVLKNGLRVILSEDHIAPTFGICVTYDVGSRNERPGRTGFAHLFEHMMFQGSENVGKGEQMILIANNGGGMNGSTTKDRTNYFETLPSNQLDLALFLESDRMRSLAINQANLENQRNAVQEERRLGVDNQPYGKTFETIDDTAYDNPAYKHSTIGSMTDLNAASVDDVTAFFKMYYAPNNAVLTLVGNFTPAEAMAKIEKYFGSIPRQPDPPPVDMTEPPQTAERRKTLEDSFAKITRLDLAYKVPPGNTADWYALDVLGDILAGGQSSRMYQELVKDKELVTGVFAGVIESRGPALFRVVGSMRPGKDPADVEKAMYADIEKVKSDGVTQAEIDKVLMGDRVNLVRQLQSSLGRAVIIGQYAVNFHDPGLINTRLAKFQSVTAADVKRVAQQYLTQNNRTVITTVPKTAAPAGSGQ